MNVYILYEIAKLTKWFYWTPWKLYIGVVLVELLTSKKDNKSKILVDALTFYYGYYLRLTIDGYYNTFENKKKYQYFNDKTVKVLIKLSILWLWKKGH